MPDPQPFTWTRRHLLGLEELSADEIRFVLDTADSFKEVSTRSIKKVPALRGRVVVNAFFEDSTRTRTSFELAARLTKLLAGLGFAKIGRGVLDITLYRDDLSEIGPRPLVRPTQLAIHVDGVPLVLVDDVVFTGRSVRAALDALSDFGRPSAIRLAVLVERAGRELPIQPDFVGLHLTAVPPDHRVNVRFRETDGADQIVVEKKA